MSSYIIQIRLELKTDQGPDNLDESDFEDAVYEIEEDVENTVHNHFNSSDMIVKISTNEVP